MIQYGQPYYYNNIPNYMSPQMNRLNQMEQQYPQFSNGYIQPNNQQMINQNQIGNIQSSMYLQGRMVESREVVKVIDAPLDGSIIYLPQTDGNAIYTKQLQKDGTSKTIVYELSSDGTSNNLTIKSLDGVSKEDIEKIYGDISEMKKSLEEKTSSIIEYLDNLKDEFQKEINKTKSNFKGVK